MMLVRHAEDQDIPQIVELLKTSLGENLMPKSETYWRWKHVDNPFGSSPVLVAEESGQLIGVRAFMRWEWTDGEQVYKTVRAVDTATHPAHQGKGIFKKLTLQLIDECKADGVHFIFNTPNTQSRPGYLKMGWKDAGQLPIRIFFGNPLAALASRTSNDATNEIQVSELLTNGSMGNLLEADKIVNLKHLTTQYSVAYLKWRYSQVPVTTYQGMISETGSDREMLIYRLKKSKIGGELRVTDYFSNRSVISAPMLKSLRQIANRTGATHLTFSGAKNRIAAGFTIRKGPMVTIRDIQFQKISALHDFQYWQPSLGDLELF